MIMRMMGGWSNWDSTPEFMQQMMQQYYGGLRPFWGLSGILDLVTSVLVIVFLIAAIRWLWKKGGEKR